MSLLLCPHHLRTRYIFAAVACLALATASVSVRAWLMPAAISPAPRYVAPESVPIQSQTQTDSMEAELVTAIPTGFEPREITRPPGAFLLMVDNRSGLSALDLRLAREAGQSLRQVRVPREQLDWSDVLDLAPGRYALTEAKHPDWVCHIIVSPR